MKRIIEPTDDGNAKRIRTEPGTELAMPVSETSSKIHEPKSYDESVADPIHGTRWRQAVDEELHSLNQHNTRTYEKLPEGQKAIGCK